MTDDDWYACLEKSIHYKKRIAKKISLHTCILAVNNAIRRWEMSTGKLVRVRNTGISPDFIGLLIRQRRLLN